VLAIANSLEVCEPRLKADFAQVNISSFVANFLWGSIDVVGFQRLVIRRMTR
jgi:hypothetical protein